METYMPILPFWAALAVSGVAALTGGFWVTFVVTMGTNLEGWKKYAAIIFATALLAIAVFGVCSLPSAGQAR
jgi:hypothetical protein